MCHPKMGYLFILGSLQPTGAIVPGTAKYVLTEIVLGYTCLICSHLHIAVIYYFL